MTRIQRITTVTFCILSLLFCQSSAVWAISGKVTVNGANGLPMAGQTLKIVDLTTNEEVGTASSDDDGIINFDFPNRGAQYAIVDQQGKQVMTYQTPHLSTGEWIAAGAGAAVVAVGIAVAANDDSSGSGSSVPTATELTGNYNISGPKTEDTCNRSPQTSMNSDVPSIDASGSSITIHSSANMQGSYNPETGAVDVAGSTCSGTNEAFQGTARKSSNGAVTLTGTLTYTDPDGCRRTYAVTYTKY